MSKQSESDFQHDPALQPEVLSGRPEELSDPIGSLIDQLGFVVSPELREATDVVTAALLDDTVDRARLRQAWIEYSKLAEQATESIEGTAENRTLYAKIQVATMIHKALIFRAASDTRRYLEELDRAEGLAVLERFDDVSLELQDEIDSKIEALDMSPTVVVLRLRGEIDESNREFLRDALDDGDDLPDVIGHAYGIIIDEGGNPDEVFERLGLSDLRQ